MSTIRKGAFALAFAVLAVAHVNAALLTGNVAPAPASNNLTLEGTLDWIHWGLNQASDVNRKITGLSQISNYTLIGAGTNRVRFDTGPSRYSWLDGSPTAVVNNTPTGVYINNFDGPGRGFEFTAPADLLPRILRVYVGEFGATGTLTAMLSDNSAEPFSLAMPGMQAATVQGVYTLNYAADSPGQTLTVRWVETTDLNPPGGADNITLQAATLSVIPEPAGIALLAAGATMLLRQRRRN